MVETVRPIFGDYRDVAIVHWRKVLENPAAPEMSRRAAKEALEVLEAQAAGGREAGEDPSD